MTRMIHLLPHEDRNAPIECKLFDYDLSQRRDQSHIYEALSYCWESKMKPEFVTLNGFFFSVTKNLYNALLHLRDRQLERTLWIDAMCINQGDMDEKSKQIPLMRIIYAQAGDVIVWLGDGREDGDKVLKRIHCLAEPGEYSTTYFSEEDRVACLKLLQRDWFRRIWVR